MSRPRFLVSSKSLRRQGLRRRPVAGGLVLDELEGLHEAHAAHVADRARVAALQLLEARAQERAHALRRCRGGPPPR